MLDKKWEDLGHQRSRRNATSVLRPSWAVEATQELEQLRAVERDIAITTGWNTSTMVICRVLSRLREKPNAFCSRTQR